MAAECVRILRLMVRRPIVFTLVLLGLSCCVILKLLQSGYEKAVIIDKMRNAMERKVQKTSDMPVDNDKSKCSVLKFSTFSNEIMKLMDSNSKHSCKSLGGLDVTLDKQKVTVTGFDINYVRYREILPSANQDEPFSFGKFNWMMQPTTVETELIKGKSGFIQHALSKRCLRMGVSSEAEARNPPDGTLLMYGEKCDGPDAEFSFESNGLIRHVASKKCLEPRHANKNSPPNDTPLTLGVACNSHFQTALEGLLQHKESKMCFHPLGGGNIPPAGQKLCLYSACDQEERLRYRWFKKPTKSKIPVARSVSLSNELVEIETQFTDEKIQSDFIARIREIPAAQGKVKKSKGPENIFVLVLDKSSAAHMERKLPKSMKTLKEMKSIIFGKHASISLGDGGENFLAVLRGRNTATTGKLPSVFEKANSQGYITFYSVDKPSSLGLTFPQFPVDHSSNPLGYFAGKKSGVGTSQYCFSSTPMHNLSLSYVENFLSSYSGKAKFAVSMLAGITQWNINGLSFLDDRLQQTLLKIKHLKNTVFILTSLRGSLDGQLGRIIQGKAEARLPFLAFYSSDDISSQFSDVAGNVGMLTTPYDIYETLLSLIEPGVKSPDSSLLSKVSDRDCAEAHVPKRPCPCVNGR